MSHWLRQSAAAAVACLGAVPSCFAQLSWFDIAFFQAPPNAPIYASERLAKTPADECFDGIGVDYPPLNPDGTCDVGIPKKNQGYVWGLTQAGIGIPSFPGDEVWFGTFANPLCIGGIRLLKSEPYVNVSWACEFGESQPARRADFPLPPSLGDWRLPRTYSYNLGTRQLTDRTPSDPRYYLLSGVRSAGALGNAVFMAGPSFQQDVVFAAWNAATGAYLGSCRATELNNIRSWIAIRGFLYAGVALKEGGGAVIRWNGDLDQPFNGDPAVSELCGFEIVATLPGFPAYLASYNNERLAASLWVNRRARPTEPDLAVSPSVAGVLISPPFGPAGSLGGDARRAWKRIWSPSDYEPDPVVARTTDGGAIAYWRGYLWFGSINNNGITISAHSNCDLDICYGAPETDEEAIDLLFNVHRPLSIWRARLDPDGTAEVELLYGSTELPVLIPGTKTFESKATGHTPLFGEAGFDNPFNRYTWTAVATDRLLFGVYDTRYVLDVRLGVISHNQMHDDPRAAPGSPAGLSGRLSDEPSGYGADLWRFDNENEPARPERARGIGNFANYGIRTMIPIGGGPDLLLGTANALNIEAEGGWELHLLTAPQENAEF